MSDPLVSVLLPIFDAEGTVQAALRSLSAQSLTDFEIVAVDDGSSDRTARLLAEYAAHESRLRVIRADHAGEAAKAIEQFTASVQTHPKGPFADWARARLQALKAD